MVTRRAEHEARMVKWREKVGQVEVMLDIMHILVCGWIYIIYMSYIYIYMYI